MSREELLALASRCEQATGPDRELDCAIHEAVTTFAPRLGGPGWEPGTLVVPVFPGFAVLPAYTASLDAAMTLVPEGFMRKLQEWPDGVCWAICEKDAGDFGAIDARHTESFAGSLALALCAASLRSRAAMGEGL